jgi:hypothetical protein
MKMRAKERTLSVIITSYNCKDILKRCLDSLLRELREISHEIIVVDNNSQDGTVEEVKNLYPDVRVFANSRNVGFAGANNKAIAESKGDYLLFLNPDVIVSSGAVKELIRFIESEPVAGLISGKLVNPDGTLQYSLRNFPSVVNQIFECFFLHRLFPSLSPRLGEVIYKRDFYEEIQEVDWVSGAVMLVCRNALEDVGCFDERYFLYSEETDLCLRLRKSGWKVYYYPKAVFTHLGSTTKLNSQLFAYWLDSRLKYYKKNFSKPQILLLSLILFLNWLLRLSLSLGGALFSSKKFKEFRARLSGASIFWREIWAI